MAQEVRSPPRIQSVVGLFTCLSSFSVQNKSRSPWISGVFRTSWSTEWTVWLFSVGRPYPLYYAHMSTLNGVIEKRLSGLLLPRKSDTIKIFKARKVLNTNAHAGCSSTTYRSTSDPQPYTLLSGR